MKMKTELAQDLDNIDVADSNSSRINELEEKLKQATDRRTQSSIVDERRLLTKLDETEGVALGVQKSCWYSGGF